MVGNELESAPISVCAVITRRDLRHVNKCARRIAKSSSRSEAGHWFALVCLLALIAIIDQWLHNGMDLAHTILIEVLATGAGMLVFTRTGDERDWLGEWRYEITGEKLRFQRKGSDVSANWSSFKGYTQTDKHTIIWTNNGGALIIPEHAIPDPNDSKRMRDLIASKLKCLDKK